MGFHLGKLALYVQFGNLRRGRSRPVFHFFFRPLGYKDGSYRNKSLSNNKPCHAIPDLVTREGYPFHFAEPDWPLTIAVIAEKLKVVR